ncbi:nuclear transport factor 2 family protein [Iodidimonas sp. SYSU 1G8]|uniref:nuclear transport factor 2 family protein n=1 Tax=Iodidimonas sp. SYSU 1G8 TaxID=3133967 RepID=UPI0031FF24DB
MSLHDQLLTIERTFWRSDPDAYRTAVIEEAMFVFAETGAIGRSAALDALEHALASDRAWDKADIRDATTLQLDQNAALLTYKAAARRKNETASTVVLATSVYVRRGEDWKLAFHQQTPVSG